MNRTLRQILLGAACFIFSCGGGLQLSPPAPDGTPIAGATPPIAPNPATEGTLSQIIVFQGSADVAVQNAVHFHVPLPAAAQQARLFIYGQLLTTLFYTETARHEHPGVAGATNQISQSHSHRPLVTLSFPGGTTSTTGTGICGYYQSTSEGNPICEGQALIEATLLSHHHSFTPQVEPAGVAGSDDAAQALVLSTLQKTYPDHVTVLLDGEDVTGRFILAPLGDGTAQNPLNSEGAQADLSDLLNQAGHHRLTLRMPPDQATQSQGGRLHYVLWVKMPLGAWPAPEEP